MRTMLIISMLLLGSFLSCGKKESTTAQSRAEAVKAEAVPTIPDSFFVSEKVYTTYTYDGKTSVQVVKIDGKKFVIARHYYGIAICPFGEEVK